MVSAGILVHRAGADGPEFLLVHPGGPFWKNKDVAGWSIPKGLVDDGEDLWSAALREFAEETGQSVGDAMGGAAGSTARVALTPCRTPGRKIIHAWLVAAELDPATFVSNTFEIEWPPKSGRRAVFPEVDRAAYFTAEEALEKVHRGQRPIVLEAIERLEWGSR